MDFQAFWLEACHFFFNLTRCCFSSINPVQAFSSIMFNGHICRLPDAGCGVFKNDPQAVGSALGEALQLLGGAIVP